VRAAPVLAIAFFSALAPRADAQTLVFKRIDVVARLDPAGAVTVSETHDIAVGEEIQDFTWDVGLAAGQSFALGRLVRVMDDGSERALSPGEPTRVESYFLGRAWLRIGLKAADETIAGQRRAYRVEYTLGGAVTPAWDLPAGPRPLDATVSEFLSPVARLNQAREAWQEAWPGLDRHYRIDHDVLLPSRAGPAFALGELNYRLEWDDRVWRLLSPEREAGRPTPGIDYRVQRTLEYLPPGRPAGVGRRGAAIRMASTFLAVPIGGLLLWLAFLLVEALRSMRLSRFDPAVFESAVVSQPPELVRSLLAESHLPPDTESLLLRLAAQRRLAIRITRPSTDDANAGTELRLLAERSELHPHEAALVEALFDAGARDTTTDRVQQRYKGQEFDPDEVIAQAFARQPLAKKGRRALMTLLRLLFLAAGLALAVRDLTATGLDPYVLFAGLAGGGILAACLPGAWWRGATPAAAIGLLVPLALLAFAGTAFALVPNRPLGVDASLALAALMLSHFAGYLSTLPRPTGREGALLELLWRARRWAAAELRRAQPRLRDAWIPHLEALFLEKPLEAWRRRHGGTAGGGAPDLAAIESGAALPGPAFTGNPPPPPSPGDTDWSGGFFVWEEDEDDE
jgi:hypothetical protein